MIGKITAAALFLLILPLHPASSEDLGLAVLPFENSGAGTDEDWLTMGISESLSSALGGVHSLRLIERVQLEKIVEEFTLALSGMGDEETFPELGKLQGADRLVLGSYQVEGDRVQINLRIVDTETGSVIHGTVATGKIGDIFVLYRELSREVVDSLEVNATPSELYTISNQVPLTESIEAYRLYIRGIEQFRSGTEEGYAAALNYLEEAVEEDPDFRIAYAYLTLVHHELYLLLARRGNAYQDHYDAIFQYYEKAVEGEDHSPEFYSIMAEFLTAWGDTRTASGFINESLLGNPHDAHAWLVRWKLKGEGDPRHPDIQRALELAPGSSEVLLELGSAYRRNNKFPEAIYYLSKAYGLAPGNVQTLYALAEVYEDLGQYDKATATYEGLVAEFPNEKEALIKLAVHYYYRKEPEETAAFCREILDAFPELIEVRFLLGVIYAYLGEYGTAEKKFTEAVERKPSSGFYAEPVSMLRDLREEGDNSEDLAGLIRFLDETRKAKGEQERAGR